MIFLILDENNWKTAVQTIVKRTKNTCHSKNRFVCYNVDKALMTQQKEDEFKTVNAHLFYKAVDCAREVLSAGYIKFSVFAALVFLTFLF